MQEQCAHSPEDREGMSVQRALAACIGERCCWLEMELRPRRGQKARQTGQSESLSDREQGILKIKKMSAAQSNGVPVQYVRQMYPLFCPRSRWKQASNRPRIRTWHGKTVLGPLPCRFAPDLTFCLSVCGACGPADSVPGHTFRSTRPCGSVAGNV